jgi:hypothetical protein
MKRPKFLTDAGFIVFLTDQHAESIFQKVLIFGFKSE